MPHRGACYRLTLNRLGVQGLRLIFGISGIKYLIYQIIIDRNSYNYMSISKSSSVISIECLLNIYVLFAQQNYVQTIRTILE